MSTKEIPYIPPALPEDVLPDLAQRIAETTARWQNEKLQGYAAYQQARAQQASATSTTDNDFAKILTDGLPSTAQSRGMQGYKQLDVLAISHWAHARAYKAELDRLEAEKAAKPPDPPAE